MKKRKFFELGAAFAQFSAKADEDKYRITHEIALSLHLEFPDYNTLKNQLWWDFKPPAAWFSGSDGESLRHCYEIGKLSYLRFILALPPNPSTRVEQIDQAVRQLKYSFGIEGIPEEILTDYLRGLENDNPSETFDKFVQNFSRILRTEEKGGEPIFGNLPPDPPQFDRTILKALHLTINEASRCYEHECYMATIILCGRIVETLVANAYQVMFQENPLGDKAMGFGEMRRKLENKGLSLAETDNRLLDLIYTYRSGVVHGNITLPTAGQATGVAILTLEVINITFNYFQNCYAVESPLTDASSSGSAAEDTELTSGVTPQGEENRLQGTLKFKNREKTRGFIWIHTEDDIRFYAAAKEFSQGFESAERGKTVEFTPDQNDQGYFARSVVLIDEE